MLRPAPLLERLTSPCRQLAPPTRPPVYSRACPSWGLLQPESAMTTRPNHPLPRQDLHLQACQRPKAAHKNLLLARPLVLGVARVNRSLERTASGENMTFSWTLSRGWQGEALGRRGTRTARGVADIRGRCMTGPQRRPASLRPFPKLGPVMRWPGTPPVSVHSRVETA